MKESGWELASQPSTIEAQGKGGVRVFSGLCGEEMLGPCNCRSL